MEYKTEIASGGTSGNAVMVTITVPLPEGKEDRAAECLNFLRSMQFKAQLSAELESKHKLGRGGLSPVGGSRPVFKDSAARSGLRGYQQDFKWTASI